MSNNDHESTARVAIAICGDALISGPLGRFLTPELVQRWKEVCLEEWRRKQEAEAVKP